MKGRLLWLSMVALTLGMGQAQDAPNRAAAAADRDAAEERYQRLNSALEEMIHSQAAQQRKIQALSDELRSVREEMNRSRNSHPSHDDLKRLAGKIQEVDDKREADRKLILEELQKLAKAATAIPAPLPPAHSEKPSATPSKPSGNGSGAGGTPATSSAGGIEKGYEHTVARDQTLSLIIQAYRDQGVKVSLKQVLEANPGLDPKRLRVGQKIFIPDSSK